jgi:hypothetical protein
MSKWEGSTVDVDFLAAVLLGVDFFTLVGLFVVGCGSLVCRSQHMFNVCHFFIFCCLLWRGGGGSLVFTVEQFIYILL